MKLIVDIPDELYEHTQKYKEGGFNTENSAKLFMAIKHGTPVEDRDLISRKSLKKEISRLIVGGENAIKDAGIGNFWINGLHSAVRCIDNMKSVGEAYE